MKKIAEVFYCGTRKKILIVYDKHNLMIAKFKRQYYVFDKVSGFMICYVFTTKETAESFIEILENNFAWSKIKRDKYNIPFINDDELFEIQEVYNFLCENL
jgi:hypothetical protein